MTPVNRWKLVSLVLAGCLSYAWWSPDAKSHTQERAAQGRTKGSRISAKLAGMSTDELVRQLFAAKTVDQLVPLAERLGVVGDNDAIDAVLPLTKDPRAGVPEAIVAAFGEIATEHAVDVLIKMATDPRDDLRIAAIEALGATGNRRAEPVLIETAEKMQDAAQQYAITALADLGSERAIEVIARVASHPTDSAAHAVRALARMESPQAKAALVALVDSPSVTVAMNAIGELREVDEAMVEKLAGIVAEGDRELTGVALAALARAGEAGLPVLKEAALDGAIDVRLAAMAAMADLDNPQVLETLRTILETEEGRVAEGAASAIASIDSDEAREVLISAALADEAGTTRAVEFLMRQTGPEVDQALLVIAKSESKGRWDAVEHLLRAGNADALELAVGQARGGPSDDTKLAAMEALADSGNPAALDSLVEIVRAGGDLKARALGILGAARPEDAVVAKLLSESVQSGDTDVAAAAATALAKVGTPEARDALVAALRSSDVDVARNAAASLARFRVTDDVTAAMSSAITNHPDLKQHVMHQLIGAGSPLGIELAKQALTGVASGDHYGSSHQEAYRAISALEQAGTPAAFDVLAQSARSGDANIRAEVIASLGNTGDKRASEVVSHALRDEEASVRHAALRTLGTLGTTQARELIVGASRSTLTEDRRQAAATLRRFDDQNSTRRLTELIRDPEASVAYVAIDAVSERPEAQPALRALVGDNNVSRSIRREAAQALSYRGVTDPTIEELLASYYPE
ncbi:MAG TPA: HEAT repeat domain-containing protein [Kofleriaceae bacterium]